MDEHACADGYSPKRWRWGTFIWAHAHAQASPVVGPVAVAAAGSCGGGDRGFPPSAVGGWRGVDQYVKIESDATHPAIPPPPFPAPLFPLCPLGSSPPYASSTTLQPRLPGPAEGIAAQSTDLSPTHHFLRRRVDFWKLALSRERGSILVTFSLVVKRLILPPVYIDLCDLLLVFVYWLYMILFVTFKQVIENSF